MRNITAVRERAQDGRCAVGSPRGLPRDCEKELQANGRKLDASRGVQREAPRSSKFQVFQERGNFIPARLRAPAIQEAETFWPGIRFIISRVRGLSLSTCKFEIA